MNLIEKLLLLKEKPLSIISIVCLILVWTLNFVLKDCENIIGLVPVNTLIANNYIWNLVSSCFYENNLVKLLTEVILLCFISSNIVIVDIEQFLLYLTICILSCTIGTSFYCFVLYFSTKLENEIMSPMFGFNGILVCFLMFARHQLKGTVIHIGFPFLTYHNLPLYFVMTQIFMWFTGFDTVIRDLPFTLITFFVSWSYLRFYYRFEGQSILLGDSSDDFSFVNMFPMGLHPIAAPLTTAFYNIFAMAGIYPPLPEPVEKKHHHHLRHSEAASPPHVPPAALSEEAVVQERRRGKAMKLLEAKLAAQRVVAGSAEAPVLMV